MEPKPCPSGQGQGLFFSRQSRSQGDLAQAKSVAYHRHGAECHGRAGDDWAQEQAEDGIENTRGHGHAERVIDEGEEQVLADVPHRGATETARADDPAQVSLHEGYVSTL